MLLVKKIGEWKFMASERPIDPLVLSVQEWLNDTYGYHNQFGAVEEDGYTGQDVVNGLIRALQIELGIDQLANNFGNGTKSKFTRLKRGNFNAEQEYNMMYILQGAFWCKGYSPGGFNGKFTLDTENAVKKFQEDVGFDTTDGIVDANLMKAILNTDGFRLSSSGNTSMRIVQQMLNTEYANGYFDYIPTNGIYERKTNKAIIYALQIEQGLGNIANGNYGPSTILYTPILRPGNSEVGFNKVLQFALAANGYYISSFNGVYNSEVEENVKEFQEFMTLSVTGVADLKTIKQLLTSNGVTSRSAVACDASMIIDENTAKTLSESGFKVIGRYLTGTVGGVQSKAMTTEEVEILKNEGIKIFPIFQDGGSNVNHFNESKARKDAINAINAAFNLGFPEGTTIYFAVDFDAYDYQVTNTIIPYMATIREYFDGLKNSSYLPAYELGVYGPRNVCIRCAENSSVRSKYSFVSNMSTGFSGNLGFPMPENWAFGQFDEISIGTGEGYLEIDKNDYSGRDEGSLPTPREINVGLKKTAILEAWKKIGAEIPLLSTRPELFTTDLKLNSSYPIIDTPVISIKLTTSTEFNLTEHESNEDSVVINVEKGVPSLSFDKLIEGQVDTNVELDTDSIKQKFIGVTASIGSGNIIVSSSIDNEGVHYKITLVKDNIDVPGTEEDATFSVTFDIIIKPAFPEPDGKTLLDDLAESLSLLALAGGIFLLFAGGVVAIPTSGISAAVTAFLALFSLD